MKKVKELKPEERPRELLVKKGLSALSDKDLVTIILGSGTKGLHVRSIASKIAMLGDRILDVKFNELKTIPGIGLGKSLLLVASREFFKRKLEERFKLNEVQVKSPRQAASFFLDIVNKKKEVLGCLFLDARRRVIKREIISIGTLDSNLLHPREIYVTAIVNSSAGIILVHNHPSGSVTPSEEDIKVTKVLLKAGNLLGVPLLDHLVVSGNKWRSVVSEVEGSIL